MQKTFADLEYDHNKRKTHREQFLERLDTLIPWRAMESEIASFYPNGGKGRQPYPLRVMLRVHCVQLFYNLSDLAMHQTKKGNEWHFGMKPHIGTDAVLGLVHSFDTTAANAHDLTPSGKLLHDEEERVWADAGYRGIEERPGHRDSDVKWQIAMRPGKRRFVAKDDRDQRIERCKATVRAKVEHPFRYVKRVFGYEKVRYRGLAKNENRLAMLLGSANLMTAEPCMG